MGSSSGIEGRVGEANVGSSSEACGEVGEASVTRTRGGPGFKKRRVQERLQSVCVVLDINIFLFAPFQLNILQQSEYNFPLCGTGFKLAQLTVTVLLLFGKKKSALLVAKRGKHTDKTSYVTDIS